MQFAIAVPLNMGQNLRPRAGNVLVAFRIRLYYSRDYFTVCCLPIFQRFSRVIIWIVPAIQFAVLSHTTPSVLPQLCQTLFLL